MIEKCSRCGIEITHHSPMTLGEKIYCPDCSSHVLKDMERDEVIKYLMMPSYTRDIQCTTFPGIDGYKVTQYLSLIYIEFSLEVKDWRDMFSTLKYWSGGRLDSLDSELRSVSGFQMASETLRKEASLVGANAVVDIEFDSVMEYTPYDRRYDKSILVIATGNAVNIEKIDTIINRLYLVGA